MAVAEDLRLGRKVVANQLAQGVRGEHAENTCRKTIVMFSGTPRGPVPLFQPNQGLITWNAELRMARSGVLHGIGEWFEAEWARRWMTNAPGDSHPPRHSSPSRPQPSQGLALGVTVIAKPADGLIAWTVRMPSGKCYKQSTRKNGAPPAPRMLREYHLQRIPARLTSEGGPRHGPQATATQDPHDSEVEDLVLVEHPGAPAFQLQRGDFSLRGARAGRGTQEEVQFELEHSNSRRETSCPAVVIP